MSVCPTASCNWPATSNHRHREMEFHADDFEPLQITVRHAMHEGDGEGFPIRIPASNTGKDLQQEIASQIPQRTGCHISLQHGLNKLSLRKKTQRARLAWRSRCAVLYLYKSWCASRLEIPAWSWFSWSFSKSCRWRRNYLGRNCPNWWNQQLDFLLSFQSESGKRHFTRQFAKFDFWP